MNARRSFLKQAIGGLAGLLGIGVLAKGAGKPPIDKDFSYRIATFPSEWEDEYRTLCARPPALIEKKDAQPMTHRFEAVAPPNETDGWGRCKIGAYVEMNDGWFEQLYIMLKRAGRVECREDVKTVVEHALGHNVCSKIWYRLLRADMNFPTHLGCSDDDYPYWKKANEIRQDEELRAKKWDAIRKWAKSGQIGHSPEAHYPPKWA